MTLSEFRSWLEGFEEAMGSAPTEEQWVKIKARLDTVSDGFKYAPNPVIDRGIPGLPQVSPSIIGPYVTCGLSDADGRVLA